MTFALALLDVQSRIRYCLAPVTCFHCSTTCSPFWKGEPLATVPLILTGGGVAAEWLVSCRANAPANIKLNNTAVTPAAAQGHLCDPARELVAIRGRSGRMYRSGVGTETDWTGMALRTFRS
ncbi:MAG TPA: hypothetical protein DEV93_00660 [Chloroflexi bacterium]|nr:hypothetical protein [Chloroflexota bacterium]